MITLVGQVCSIVGVIFYEAFLKSSEVRYVLIINIVVAIFAAFANYVLAMRWNLEVGFGDIAYLYFTSVLFGSLSAALGTLPIMALFAKITPKRIEGTVFAFLTGTSNLDQAVL